MCPPEPPSPAKMQRPSKSGSRKRSISAVSEGDPEQHDQSKVPSAKRRASRACMGCRNRKVRCNVVEQHPCYNCKADNIECQVQDSRRKRKNLHSVGATQRNFRGSSESLQPRTAVQQPLALAGVDLTRAPTLRAQVEQEYLSRHPQYHPQLNNNNNMYPNASYLSQQQPPQSRFQAGFSGSDTVIPLTLFPVLQPPPEIAADQLPAFIKPISPRVSFADRQFLASRGALTLPPPHVQSALLGAYVEYVHPYMPAIDLQPFLASISDPTGNSGQVSLLLYQAVLFVAVCFVDKEVLNALKFSHTKDARRAFFQKARYLYDLDTESDRMIIVQSLLFMTYWYETPDDQKDTWHWMGVAISLAQTIGLQRDPSETTLPPAVHGLRRRIWWSCYIRDRMIALGMRRPIRINDDQFDVHMLQESDFEIGDLGDSICQMLGPKLVLARDVQMQSELAAMCVQMAKLSQLVSEMLHVQYSVLARKGVPPDQTQDSTMMLLPKKTISNMEGVKQLDQKLSDWPEQLPHCCRKVQAGPQEMQESHKVMVVQRILLHMTYLTIISGLHRPIFVGWQNGRQGNFTKDFTKDDWAHSRQRVRYAAEQATLMAFEMEDLGLVRYLPTTGVTVLLPAMIINLLDCNANEVDPLSRQVALSRFSRLKQIMNSLTDSYAAASFALRFLQVASVAARAAAMKLSVPQFMEHSRRAQQLQMQLHAQQFRQQFQQIQGVQPQHMQQQQRVLKPHPATPSLSLQEDPSTPPPEQPYLSNHGSLDFFPPGAQGHMAPALLDLGSRAPSIMGEQTPPGSDHDVNTPNAHDSQDVDYIADDDINTAMNTANIQFDDWLNFSGEGGEGGGDQMLGMPLDIDLDIDMAMGGGAGGYDQVPADMGNNPFDFTSNAAMNTDLGS